jgi:hypothetical protein
VNGSLLPPNAPPTTGWITRMRWSAAEHAREIAVQVVRDLRAR